MGEVNVQSQSQNEPINPISPQPTPNKHKQEVMEPTDTFSMMHLCHRHPPCSAANNPMKRRSPPYFSSSSEPCTKKLFCDQDDLSLINKRPFLRRCVSDTYRAPAPATDNATPPGRDSGLPPLPPSLTRCLSDFSSPPPRLNSGETATPDSVRLRKMKKRLKEMRQWWDEFMKDEEEDGGEEECAVAEDDKVLAQDDLEGGDFEEAVRVEWADQCVSLGLRCQCGKGYEVLLSENNFYYKLV